MAVLLKGAIFAFLTRLLLIARPLLKSRARLEAENLVLRRQVIVLSRKSPSCLRLRNIRWADFRLALRIPPFDSECDHRGQARDRYPVYRCGLRAYWRWKSHPRAGRPKIGRVIRESHPIGGSGPDTNC